MEAIDQAERELATEESRISQQHQQSMQQRQQLQPTKNHKQLSPPVQVPLVTPKPSSRQGLNAEVLQTKFDNMLDLGFWRSIQSAVEKLHAFKLYDADALARSVERAWRERLNPSVFEKVYNRLLRVLGLIIDDSGGNKSVESKRGKRFFSDPVLLLGTRTMRTLLRTLIPFSHLEVMISLRMMKNC
jgi:hypothetical protein